MRIFKLSIRFKDTIYSSQIYALESIYNHKYRYPILDTIIYITKRRSNIPNLKLHIIIQHTLKKTTRGNTRSTDKLFSSIGMKNTNVSNQLISRLLKVVKIVIYNIDIIKSGY
jgi:hypothetical protein